MKKTLLLLSLVLSLSNLRASDTLTIRQIFNYDVGDTFHYRIRDGITYPSYHYVYADEIKRITGKYFSANNDSVWYVESYIPTYYDTIMYTHLGSTVITGMDTPRDLQCRRTFAVDTFDTIAGTIGNSLAWDCDFSDQRRIYVAGLGAVFYFSEGDVNMGGHEEVLVSYTRSGITDSTRYVRLSVPDVAQAEVSVNMFPIPAKEQLHLFLLTASPYSYTLTLSDLLGLQVYSHLIVAKESDHDISTLPAGMYTWFISSDHSILKTGKIIKE